jgi:hypothetical protein
MQNLSIIVMVFFSDSLSFMPQNREVKTLAPIDMPIHPIWKMVINWLAKAVPDNAFSPSEPIMILSVIFTPIVIRLCNEIGIAIAAVFL